MSPTVRDSIRLALGDFFYNSLLLVAANLIWGVTLIIVLGLTFVALPAALLLLILLALPTAGLFHLAALITREQHPNLTNALGAWRLYLRPALAIGLVIGGGSVVLTVNLVVGLTSNEPLGWAFGTVALWGLVALWAVALAFWPLLVDPRRQDDPITTRLRLAVAVILVAPGRYAILFLSVFVVVFASAIMFAALVTVSISFVALAMCRYVLPAADRLEGMPTEVR